MTDDAILSLFSSLLVIQLNYWVIIHAYRFVIVVKKKYVLSSTFNDISLNTVTLSKLCHKNQNYFPLFLLDGV